MAGASPIGAGLAAALAAYQFGEGVSQTRKGKKLLNTSRPKYEIPQAETDAYNATRFNYGTSSSNVQEAGRNALDENFSQQVGAIEQTATDSSQMLAALTAANKSRNMANVTLDQNAIGQKQNDLNALLSASHVYSQFKDKEWDWNKKQPYEDTMLAASALIKAGKENKYGALNSVANVGTSLLSNTDSPTDDTTATTATDTPQGGDYSGTTNPAGSPFTTATGTGSTTPSFMGNNQLVQAKQANAGGYATPQQISLLKANGLL